MYVAVTIRESFLRNKCSMRERKLYFRGDKRCEAITAHRGRGFGIMPAHFKCVWLAHRSRRGGALVDKISEICAST